MWYLGPESVRKRWPWFPLPNSVWIDAAFSLISGHVSNKVTKFGRPCNGGIVGYGKDSIIESIVAVLSIMDSALATTVELSNAIAVTCQVVAKVMCYWIGSLRLALIH